MLPVVAIVGRPNVGKSTLFNRLTKTRNALISDFPGMTRDRQFGDVHIDGRHFIIIDTGGITTDKDDIGKLITQQALQAMQDADKILFLIDGKAGVTKEDLEIAKHLRKLNKPLVLAVNKTEGLDSTTATTDAFELGLKTQPVPIAAVHGQGTARLIAALFPESEKERMDHGKTEGIRLAIIGRPNVGKSTLTNRMLGEDRVIAHDSPGTTRDSIYIPLERHGQRYTLIDTAGVRKRKKVSEAIEKFSIVKTLQTIENTNVVLYIIDARLGVSEQDLKLLSFILECGKALVIAFNKWDDINDDEKTHVKATIERHLDFVSFARVHFISALHGSGVGNLFDSVKEAYESANKKLSTPVLTRLLEKAQTTHSPPLVKGRRIKLRYAHAGGQNPPIVVIHGNQVDSLPDSYRKFLSHFFIEKLGLYGTPVEIQFKSSKNPYAPEKKP